MAGGRADGGAEQWLFTEEALARVRETAHEAAAQSLRGSALAARAILLGLGAGARETVRPLSLEQASRLVLFYAQKLPELCNLCGAPADVRWTAIVFFRRFFAMRSPMEFDPLLMMIASVHVACKTEEVHEITLGHLLRAAGYGANASLAERVAALELPFLEGLDFSLLVEPKPDSALCMLMEDLQCILAQGRATRSGTSPAKAPLPALPEQVSSEVVNRAEEIALQVSVHTDAVLRWPASILVVAALCAAFDDHFAQVRASTGGDHCDDQVISRALASLMDTNLPADTQRATVRQLVADVRRSMGALASQSGVTEESVNEALQAARRCHSAFDHLREEAAARHEANRKERKRRWSDIRRAAQGRAVPTPTHQALVDLSRRASGLRGDPAPGPASFDDAEHV